MNKLSITSRILIAFATVSLLVLFFHPAWRIDLYAPQYPEGLSMYIWINDITGDVDIINGLNHYIGMRNITVDMFPEFMFIPYVVGFFLLFGLAVSITGSRKLLFYYVLLTVVGAILVLYDLYRWGYDYGHNLDPMAAIQVPGLSYQPPVIGHKRLLNFDAYSYPDAGGWIVIGAGILAGLVWFFEWKKHRTSVKKRKAFTSPLVIVALIFLLGFSSCSTEPEPFAVGKDDCHVCKMGIADLRFGGELITKKGKIYKFDDMRCMMDFIKSGTVEEKEISKKLFMNFEKPNEFLDVKTAWFVASKEMRSPMNSNISAFANKTAAENILKDKQGEIVTWDEIYQRVK